MQNNFICLIIAITYIILSMILFIYINLIDGCAVSTDTFSYIGSAMSFSNGEGILHHPLHHLHTPPNTSYAPGVSILYSIIHSLGIHWVWIPAITAAFFWLIFHFVYYLTINVITKNNFVSLFSIIFTTIHWSIIKIFGYALSEPVYIGLLSIFLLLHIIYIQDKFRNNITLLFIAIIGFLLFICRYSSNP